MRDPDLEVAQLLCTRLCHDLAGPVGAVAAGVELIGGDPAQVDMETLGLIGNSSAAAALKLKFMRAALGTAGSSSGDPKALLEGYLQAVAGLAGRPTLTWPGAAELAAGAASLGSVWVQIMLNLSLLGLETQPGCRGLAVQITGDSDLTVIVEAQGAPGRTAEVRDDFAAALAGRTPPVLGVRTVHAFVTGRLVRAAGGRIELAASGGSSVLTAHFRAAEASAVMHRGSAAL